INDIFFNAPARRKFLKSSRTEFQHIERVVKNMALCNPQVQMRLVHNDKQVRYYKKTHRKQRIQQIAGNHFLQNAVEMQVEHQNWKITGYVGNADALRKNADLQYVFINNRCVKDKIIYHAIKNAFYEQNSLHNAFLSFILFLECPFDEIDINVHPTKAEVRFHDPTWVHDFVQANVEKAYLASMPKTQAFCVSGINPTIYYKQEETKKEEERFCSSNTIEPPITLMQFFWEHFYFEGGKDLYIIDLKKNQQAIWEHLIQERIHCPFPRNLILFPKKLRLEYQSTLLLEKFGFTFRDNAKETSLLSEKPAFLHEEEMQRLLLNLTHATPATRERSVYNFFKQLPWPVFLRHDFFKSRFSAWCKARSKHDLVVLMDPNTLQDWIALKIKAQ
ncbi:MAG TPA: DNA mismatch repair endonuclease MutL, partial [Gammaproteobacteria bacterium]|nr:DNA mismatch repair endonuclease MutL [Gammaproteobacteria bacterium]